MSAGSDASNIGYGNTYPFSNINKNYVNVDSNNNPYHFGSNQISGLPGLAGAKSNIDAAKSYVPGICLFKGGAKKFKNKINKISRKYKMKNKSKSLRLKHKLRSKYSKKSKMTMHKRKHRKTMKKGSRRSYKGGSYNAPIPFSNIPYPPGYHQYQNNYPDTPSYSVGANLSANESALANPPPYKVLSNCTNCVDNYNHYTGKGFPSRGH
jgi:hypothetical protein